MLSFKSIRSVECCDLRRTAIHSLYHEYYGSSSCRDVVVMELIPRPFPLQLHEGLLLE